MRSWRCMVGLMAAWIFVATALGTDRYYPDSQAVSLNGAFRLDAKSPENAPSGRGRPFAANFVYTLTDTRTGKVVWTRHQPMRREKGNSRGWSDEGSPMMVFVDDTGACAAYVSGERMVFMAAKDGAKAGEISILDSFPEAEKDKHVSWSTAGPMWTSNSTWSFVSVPRSKGEGEDLLFVIRPNWGSRLVMDTTNGKLVVVGRFAKAMKSEELTGAGADVERLMRGVLAGERAKCLRVLETAADLSWEKLVPQGDYYSYRNLAARANLAGQLRLKEAVPSLRRLETMLIEATKSKREGDGYVLPELFRQVRMALRRMGETPREGYGVALHEMKSYGAIVTQDSSAAPMRAWVPVADRIANAPKVKAGMSVRELNGLIGCPDAETYEDGADCYDYDIDGPEPYTLRVCVRRGTNEAEGVRKIVPPVYLDGTKRDGGW